MRTGLILLAPDAEALVADFRDEVPAHVTVLFPFRRWEEMGLPLRAQLATIFRQQAAISVTFTGVGRFPGVVWLKPEPRDPIDRLTRTLVQAFPDCLPYEGAFPDPVPHLTALKSEDDAALESAQRILEVRLAVPLATRLNTCALYAETETGWREVLRFRLGG